MTETVSEVGLHGLVFPVRTAGRGDGDPVVFLHGFPQTSAAWSPYLTRFAGAGFRAIAPDLRGYASTARPAGVGQYTVDLLVADVMGIADDLGLDRFHLVGHDWGGTIGWAVAAAHPGRLLSLTSVSTPHPRALASSLLRSFQLLRIWYIGLFQVPQVPERLLTARNGALLRRLLTDAGLPAAHVAAYTETMLQPEAMTAALNYYRALSPRRAGAIGRISVPTLYVWGDKDPALGPLAARLTREEVDAPYRFEVFEGAGHWIPETRSHALTAVLLDHVRSHSPSSGGDGSA